MADLNYADFLRSGVPSQQTGIGLIESMEKARQAAEAVRRFRDGPNQAVVVGPLKGGMGGGMGGDTATAGAPQVPPQPQLSPGASSQVLTQQPAYEDLRAQLLARASKELDNPEDPLPAPQFTQFYTPDFVKERVNQLRGDRALGAMLSVAGDPAIAQTGHTLMQSDPTAFMQDAAREERGRQYQQYQADYTSREKPGAALSRTLSVMNAIPSYTDVYGRLGANGGLLKPTGAIQDRHMKRAEAIRSTRNIISQYKPEYGQVLGKLAGPLHAALPRLIEYGWEGLVEKFGVDPKAASDAVLYFAQLEELVTMIQRATSFGLTLTQGEQEAWRRMMAVDMSTNPTIFQERMSRMVEEMEKAGRFAQNQLTGLYGQDIADSIYGEALNPGQQVGIPGGGAGGYTEEEASLLNSVGIPLQ